MLPLSASDDLRSTAWVRVRFGSWSEVPRFAGVRLLLEIHFLTNVTSPSRCFRPPAQIVDGELARKRPGIGSLLTELNRLRELFGQAAR